MPVLLAHPGADRWTPAELSDALFARLAGPKRFVMLEGCGHYPLEEPGLGQLESAFRDFATQCLCSAEGSSPDWADWAGSG